MKILVTGGLGFHGAHLAKHLLHKGHDVTLFNTLSPNSESRLDFFDVKPKIIWGSVADKELVHKSVAGQDTVFHLAARINVDESIQDPVAFFDANITGTINVLEAVRANQNRLIYASTCAVYGVTPGVAVVKEDAELRPYSPYAASKAAADRICFSYFKTYGTDVAIARPFNIYGEGQKEKQFGALIAILINKALQGENLKVFGDGSQTRDYMNINDLVRAYELILDSKNTAGEVFNLGTGVETSVKDIAEYIAKKLGVGIEYGPARAGEVARFVADVNKLKEWGFSSSINIWEGIDRYIEWRKLQK